MNNLVFSNELKHELQMSSPKPIKIIFKSAVNRSFKYELFKLNATIQQTFYD